MANQDTLQQLRNAVKAAQDVKERARADLEQKKGAVFEKRSLYLRLKMENEQLDNDIGEREDNCWYKIEKELGDKMNKMSAVLSVIDAEKSKADAMVVSHSRKIRDITKNFCGETMQLETIELKKECDAKFVVINEQEKQIADKKVEMAEALGRKDNDNADAFVKDLKMKIIEIESLIRRRKRTTSK